MHFNLSSGKYHFGSPPPDSSDDEQFSYQGNSSSGDETGDEEQTVMVHFFKKIYKDPHQDIMDKLDGHAADVLRTGKITVSGNAGGELTQNNIDSPCTDAHGYIILCVVASLFVLLLFRTLDMNLLQPLLFSLQATDEELPIILPQLLRNPFFKQKEVGRQFAGAGFYTSATADSFLSNGFFRLQVPIDQVIYELLQSHCCKGPGAIQAEALINSAFSVTQYGTSPGTMHHVRMTGESAPPFVAVGYTCDTCKPIAEEEEEDREDFEELPAITKAPRESFNSDSDYSSISGCSRDKSSSVDLEAMESVPYLARHPTLSRFASLPPNRRVSVIDRPPLFATQSLIPGESSRHSVDSNKWQCSVQHNMIVGAYGDNSYSLLTWNTELQLEVKLTGSQHPGDHALCSSPAVIDSKQPVLTVSIKNPTDHTVAFSIRANRQSKLFASHIIYPTEGLQLLRAGEVWEREMDVVEKDAERDEHFVMDILICAMEGATPSWNISRQYAVLKRPTQ